MDAQRNELFAAKFARGPDGEWFRESETEIVSNDTWLQQLTSETAISGPGVIKLLDRLPAPVPRADSANWAPRAATIGQIAYERFSGGVRRDVFQLMPRYFRRSAAEEKRDAAAN